VRYLTRPVAIVIASNAAVPAAVAHINSKGLPPMEGPFDPWVWLPLLIGTWWYLRGIWKLHRKQASLRREYFHLLTAFGAALITLLFSLLGPLDTLSTVSFAAHMAQHMLLIAVAAPLLILAEPSVPLMIALPQEGRQLVSTLRRKLRRIRRVALLPKTAFFVHAAVIWLWHAPLLFELALQRRWLHIIEHFTLLGSALWFWASLKRIGRRSSEGYGIAALWTLATLIHTGVLGALITFARRPIYAHYVAHSTSSLTSIEDQQLAGLVMWVPTGTCYLLTGLLFAWAWLKRAESEDRVIFPAARSDSQPLNKG
jgi:putative membrane protein